MRLLGAVLLLAAGTLLGVARASALFRRVRMLEALEAAIRGFQAGIRYSGSSLEELIRGDGSPLCRLARERSEFPHDPKAALLAAGESLLTVREDREALAFWVSRLGESVAQDQLDHLALCREKAEALSARAREQRDRNAKLYIAAGAFGGAALCLILL